MVTQTSTLKRTRWLRATLAAGFVVFASLVGASLWLKSLFNERSAERVPSLAAHLKTKSLVAVFAHPDDEISVAGFLAEAAQRNGVMVRIITATKGESGHPRPPICRPEDLGKIREAETLKDGFALGVQEQEVWTFPDGRLSEVPPEELAAKIDVRLRKWKPDLVVTFDPGSGFTLHPDHLAIGRATVLALREMAVQNQETPPRLLYPLAPRKALTRFGGEIGRTVAARQPAPQLLSMYRPESRCSPGRSNSRRPILCVIPGDFRRG